MASEWLISWLESLSLSEYTALFAQYGYTQRRQFLNLDKAVLKNLGLVKVGHQNRILRAVDKLKLELGEVTSLSSSSSSSLSEHSVTSDSVHKSNGVPPGGQNSDHAQNHTHQSLMNPTTLSSSSTATVPPITPPPPVPVHRANRNSGGSYTLPPSSSTTVSASHLPLVPQGGLDVPPVVKPRQQSLMKRDTRDGEILPTSSTLPPHSSTRSPQKAKSTSHITPSYPRVGGVGVADHTHSQNHTPIMTSSTKPSSPKVKPKPTPRTHSRSPSDQKPVPLPRKSSGKREGEANTNEGPPTPNEGVQFSQLGEHQPAAASELPAEEEEAEKATEPVQKLDREKTTTVDGNSGGLDLKHLKDLGQLGQQPTAAAAAPAGEEEIVPAIPVKRSPKFQGGSKVIIPSDDIIFELENEQIPETVGTPVRKDLPVKTDETKTEPNQTTVVDYQNLTVFSTQKLPVSGSGESEKRPIVHGEDGSETAPPPPVRTDSGKKLPQPNIPHSTEKTVNSPAPPPVPHRNSSTKISTSAVEKKKIDKEEDDDDDDEKVPTPPRRVDSVKRTEETPPVTVESNTRAASDEQWQIGSIKKLSEATIEVPPLPDKEPSPVPPSESIASPSSNQAALGDPSLPPLPPKHISSPPPFTPPPPPQSPPPSPPPSSSPIKKQSSASSSSPPLVPPRSSASPPPPPPPPLSEPFDSDSCSDSEEDENKGRFRSITSSSLTLPSPGGDDNILAVTPVPESPLDSDILSPFTPATPLSSEEGTPRRISQLLIPQPEGRESSEIMVYSPEPPRDEPSQEEEEEEVKEMEEQKDREEVDKVEEEKKKKLLNQDYENQEIFAAQVAAADTEKRDYVNCDVSSDPAVMSKREANKNDYANQEMFTLTVAQKKEEMKRKILVNEDYANQEIIDTGMPASLKVCDGEGDYADSRKLGTIRGATPIRSRTLSPDRSDYMNQELLDEDIIPVSIVTPNEEGAPVLIPESLQLHLPASNQPPLHNKDYVNLIEQPLDGEADGGIAQESILDIRDTRSNHTSPNLSPVISSHHLVQPRLSVGSRRSMSPVDDRETALDFIPGRGSPQFGPELVPVRTGPGSGYSSGATTPGGLSLDSVEYYFDDKPPSKSSSPTPTFDEKELKPRAETRATVRISSSSGRCLEQPSLPPSSGTFACHQPNKKKYPAPRKSTSIGDVVDGPPVYDHMPFSYPLSERAEELANVPRCKEGYLHKKGGKLGQRPWQKRWTVFSGEELKYFNDKNSKESDALNHVNLKDMIDVKRINDADSDKQHRFDLVVIGRVFQFFSESREDCDNWVEVLHAAIARFQPKENDTKKAGGSLHDPEKQGPLLKQGRGMRTGFRERYVALKGSKFAYYENKEAFVHARPIHILELALANVRPDPHGKQRFIITMHNQKTYTFQAAKDIERQGWLDAITEAILRGLVDGEKAPVQPTKKETGVHEIMAQIQENPANKVCADCLSMDPSWGVVNLGIMVCIECSGVHRSMGILISKVRSLELDRSIWTSSLVQLMVAIGNDRSNQFWERHCQRAKLEAGVERDIRESFIRAKYQDRSWIPQPSGEPTGTLSRQLLVSVASNDLMKTIQLLIHGADVSYEDPDEANPDLKTCMGVAKHHGQKLQVELLEQNRALSGPKSSETLQLVSKKGYLYKTGSERTGWKRRWCTLDQFRGLEYFRSENDPESQGDVKVHEMLSISLCDEEKDPRYPHCFELNTQSRGYLFCADSKADMEEWVTTLRKVIPRDGAEKLGYDKVGYLRKKDPHNVGGWKRRWFTLKGKSLVYYKREREELSEIDLRKVVELKCPDPNSPPESQCCFQICLLDRVYTLRAETSSDADSWMTALRHTQVSGIPLSEQQTVGHGIPVLVHKCLDFVETFGLETEGIYRMSGNLAKIRKLILSFNQDARGLLIKSEDYTVHDVAGVLKDFFKSLPDPLLTHSLYPHFIQNMKVEHEQQMVQLKSLIEQLPQVNRETLKRVIGHLNKVIDHESKNKMGRTNLVSLFAPTLMTVNADAVSMTNAKYEFMCLDKMIQYYKWLFDVKDEEEAKEKELEEAKEKLEQAMRDNEKMKQRVQQNLTSNMRFLNTIYILSRSGDTYGTYITPETLVGELVEEVAANKNLPPDHYALYLVIGDGDSYRVLSSSDRLLGALSSVGSECHLCLKPNTFYESIKPFMNLDGWESVPVHVREKKKWKKYPCAVRGKNFVQFKDNRLSSEVLRLPVTEVDVFAGMDKAIRTDHRNPMPTRNFFWLKPTRGLEDQTRYLCTDSEQDLQKLMAALVKAKYGPEGLQTPLMPTTLSPHHGLEVRRSTINVSPKSSPTVPKRDQFATTSVQYTKR